jgi:hypothetical protein
MHRLAALVAIGATLALFQVLTRHASLPSRSALALAFVLVLGLVASAVARRGRVPAVTLMLALGVAAGPAWLALLHADELRALAFAGDAALALLGATAGSALAGALRTERPLLVRGLIGAAAAPAVLVALVLVTVLPWFPLSADQPFGDGVLVVAAVALAATLPSPAVPVAMLAAEPDARGTGAEVRDVSAAAELLGGVALVVVLLTAGFAASPGTLRMTAVWRIAAAVGGGVAAGVALGEVTRWTARRLGPPRAAWLAGPLACVAAGLGALGLPAPLVGLGAGAMLRRDAALADAIAAAAPLAAAVYFPWVGAALGPALAWTWWPWIALVVGVRAQGVRLGVRWAGRGPAVTPALAPGAWPAFLSQAGFAVGVAGLARQAFPEWGVSFEAFVLSVIAVHAVAGPLLWRRALRRVASPEEGVHVGTVAAGAGMAGGSGGSGV